MPCYHPLSAAKGDDGSIIFNPRSGEGDPIKLPCGQCMGCRIDRSRMWAVRCMHEASLYENNCFITLTYADEYLPPNGELDYEHYQKFMKRLRKAFPKNNIRFYMCGEYGEKFKRPHFHAILFNFDFPDKVPFRANHKGDIIYVSKKLSEIWPYGHASVGKATEQSAAYVARYVTQKATGRLQDTNPKTGEPYREQYFRGIDPETGERIYVTPEFNKMSLKPGIAQAWFDKFHSDVYPQDSVRLRDGRRIKPPRFYDKKFDALEPYEFEAVKQQRILNALKNHEDNTPERLAVKERVLLAKTRQLIRPIE
jgi:hypothetical protein